MPITTPWSLLVINNIASSLYTLILIVMSFTTSYTTISSAANTWQDKLEEKCREVQVHPPVFQIMSDRRGGRTAWSSTVTVSCQRYTARFWYDGQFVNNAKEDAAEVALQHLNTQMQTGWPAFGPWSWRATSGMMYDICKEEKLRARRKSMDIGVKL